MPSESFRQRARNCVLLTITVICLCIIVLCGVVIVREYSLAKDYEPTTCKITNITYEPDMLCTFCESKDKTKEAGASSCIKSKMPCIHIGTRYQLNGSPKEALLHPDSIQAVGAYSKCSFSVCLKHYALNKKAVLDFAQQWSGHKEKTSSFPCFYNTKAHSTIIVKKVHTKEHVIHSMLWPGLVIILCGAIFLRLEMKNRGVGLCETIPNPTGRRGDRSNVCNVRNGGSGTGGDSYGDVKQTLLHAKNDINPITVECSLLKNQGTISSSMPALDHLKLPGDNSKHTPSSGSSGPWLGKDLTIGSSLSVDGLRLHQVRSMDDHGSTSSNRHLLSAIPKDKMRQDSTKTDGSSTGSQGSKIMGLETPV